MYFRVVIVIVVSESEVETSEGYMLLPAQDKGFVVEKGRSRGFREPKEG